MPIAGYFFVSFTLFLLFAFTAKFFHRKQRNSIIQASFHHVLPRVRNTFINLHIVDGIINLLKFRTGGIKVFDQLMANYGPNFMCNLAHLDFVFISDPHIIKKLLNSNISGHLTKPSFLYRLVFTDVLKNSLLIAETDIWSSHRKTISRAFTYKQLISYVSTVDKEIKLLVRSAHCIASGENGLIDQARLGQLLEDHAIAALVGIILGSKIRNVSEKERTEFHRAFKRAQGLVRDRILKPHMIFPPIWILHKNKRELDRMAEIVNHFSSKMIQSYRTNQSPTRFEKKLRNNCNRGETKQSQYFNNEMLDTVEAESHDVSETTSGCLVQQMIMAGHGDQEILDEVNMFLVAGYETILMAVHFTLFYLAANIRHQSKCREETDMMMDSGGFDDKNRIFTVEHLSELKHLERCILETLRICPPIPCFARQLDTPLELDEDQVVEAGQNIAIIPWTVHRNPEYFPNPEKFDPDRFLPENVKHRHSHVFIPFSMGPRNCIGWKVAMLEIKVIVARILRSFEFTTTDKPDDVKILFGVSLLPERPYNITFKMRNR